MKTVFHNIQSQPRVQNILTRFIDTSKIPHALLFTGIEGTGKYYIAIKFAQELNICTGENHDKEKLVKQISQLSEPYIKFVFPLPRGKNENDESSPTEKLSPQEIEIVQMELQKKIANPYHKIIIPKANAIKINSIRDIKKFLSLDYSDLSYRVIIISDAHLMNEAAQNALLKNLEEPPANVIFILTTPYPSRLRETIRSRCWNVNFDPLDEEEVASILRDFFGQDKEIAESVAPFSDGSVQTALKLIDMDFYNLRETTISILRYSFGRKFNSAFDEVNKVLADQSPENINLVIKMIITWLNDLQKQRFQLKKYFFKEHVETLEKFNTKFPDVDLQNITFTLDKLSTLIKSNININLLTANLIFELSALTAKRK